MVRRRRLILCFLIIIATMITMSAASAQVQEAAAAESMYAQHPNPGRRVRKGPSKRKPLRRAVDSLIDSLKAGNVTVKRGGRVSQPFFTAKGQELKVNNESVQVFEYANAAAAEREAKEVSPNGSSVGTNMMSWLSTPHFYRKGNLIVIYVGTDAKVMGALQAALGAQFAGG